MPTAVPLAGLSLLTIGAHAIPYSVRRSQRARRIRIAVRPGAVEVTAPLRTPRSEITAALAQTREWIARRVAAFERTLAAHPGSAQLAEGGRILLRGRPMEVTVGCAGRAAVRCGAWLEVEVPDQPTAAARESAVEAALRAWLIEQARADATALAQRHGAPHGLVPRAIRIKAHKRLWGSCTARDVINLNWRLVLAPPAVLEYVVVHELCHLRERHHQPAFWRLVRAVLPGYERPRRWLRANGALLTLKPFEQL